MEKSITAPTGLVNIVDKYHKNSQTCIKLWDLVNFYTNVSNILEKYDKY
jgi:hypothetical protein